MYKACRLVVLSKLDLRLPAPTRDHQCFADVAPFPEPNNAVAVRSWHAGPSGNRMSRNTADGFAATARPTPSCLEGFGWIIISGCSTKFTAHLFTRVCALAQVCTPQISKVLGTLRRSLRKSGGAVRDLNGQRPGRLSKLLLSER